MTILRVMRKVLGMDAAQADSYAANKEGKTVAQVIGQALAAEGMKGDVKAIALLMELAGEDFRSRDSDVKHQLDREKLNLNPKAGDVVALLDERPDD